MAKFFWKHKGMVAHWKHAHKTKTMSADLWEQLKISAKDKSGIVNASDAAATPVTTAAAARRLSEADKPTETAVAAAKSAAKEAAEEAASAAAMGDMCALLVA
jgi:hypothetical protein